MSTNNIPPYPWEKNLNGFGGPRQEPLMYGPGPKYRNVPVENCKPGVPPPFMLANSSMPPPAYIPTEHGIPSPGKHPITHGEHRQKYFYTVLFLDGYYEKDRKNPVVPSKRPAELRTWDVCADTESANIRWLDQNRLYVRHNLALPITLEMWDNENRPIVYCPIMKKDVNNVTLGDVVIESERAIIINFFKTKRPEHNQIYKLAIRSLPDFQLAPEDNIAEKSLADMTCVPRCQDGLALVFRRNTLDGLYDLISEFDEAYYHSMDDNSDLKYLTEKSCYKDVHFVTKYSNNLQDVLDLIDINYYHIQYSWEDHKKYKN